MAKRGNPNPTGSKPDKLMRDALIIALKREVKVGGKKTKRFAQIVEKMAQLAADGDGPLIREIFDRVDGKVSQAITGKDGGPLEIDLTNVPDELLDQIEDIHRKLTVALGGTAGTGPESG